MKKKSLSNDMIWWWSELNAMLRGELSLQEALATLTERQDKAWLRDFSQDVWQQVKERKSFSQALSAHPHYVNAATCSMVQAAESDVDQLADALLEIIHLLRFQKRHKARMVKLFFYPLSIIALASAILSILMIFVIPVFAEMFSSMGHELPFMTVMMFDLSHFVVDYFFLIASGIAAFGFAIFFSVSFRYRLGLLLPGISREIKTRILIEMLTLLGALARNHQLSVEKMAGILADTVSDPGLAIHIRQGIKSGTSFEAIMGHIGWMPARLWQVSDTCFASGSLESFALTMADMYENDPANDTHHAITETIIMIIVGLIVGTVVVSMYLPIFSMASGL